MLVFRSFTFWTTVVISGWTFLSAFTKLFFRREHRRCRDQDHHDLPVAYRLFAPEHGGGKPYPVSSSNTFILNDGSSSRIVPMISSAFYSRSGMFLPAEPCGFLFVDSGNDPAFPVSRHHRMNLISVMERIIHADDRSRPAERAEKVCNLFLLCSSCFSYGMSDTDTRRRI